MMENKKQRSNLGRIYTKLPLKHFPKRSLKNAGFEGFQDSSYS